MISHGISVQTLGMRGALDVPRVFRSIRKLIAQLQPDIIQTWMYHADFIGGLAARAAGHKAIIWGVRNTDMIRGTSYRTFAIRRACAALSRGVPAVIVCAAEASRASHAAIGYAKSKMIVIPNGFDSRGRIDSTASRTAFRAAGGWTEEQVVVGHIGRFNFYKDHANFIRAAGRLAQRYRLVRFAMIGKQIDWQNQEIVEQINATGFADRFQLFGFRSDVANCLAGMDVFCLSSRSEGFPNVVGEAMSAAVPCVATDVGDVRLLLSDAGIVVPKENPTALFEGLARVVAMPRESREALGLEGRSRVTGEFSMQRVREKYEAIYRSLSQDAFAAAAARSTD